MNRPRLDRISIIQMLPLLSVMSLILLISTNRVFLRSKST